jgi:D-amino-acid dehydrogenase
MKVTIIGAGVIGLCSAYYLHKEGYEVAIVEKTNGEDGCSFGNMGYISPSHFIPLATPGIIKQGLKWMLSASSPFYIKPRLNIDLLKWGMHFYKSANAQKVAAHAPHLNNLLQLSRALSVEIKNELPDPFQLIENGIWMLYKNTSTQQHELELAKQAETYGLKTMICNANEVQEIEKEVTVNVLGGVMYVDDCHVNPRELMQSLKKYLTAQGVQFVYNATVTNFEIRNGKVLSVLYNADKINTDAVVVANGSWIQGTAKLLGAYLPLQPGKGYSMQYTGLQKNLKHPSILVDDRVATTPINDGLRIGGTMEISGHNHQKLPNRYNAIYHSFKKYYPDLKIEAPVAEDVWFGYRPVSPDGMPYIGKQNKLSNVVFAGGHAMLGISAAAGTGVLVNELITGKKTTIDITAFKPERF